MEPFEPRQNETLGTLGTLGTYGTLSMVPIGRPRPASKDAFRGEITAVDDAVLADGFLSIMTASRREPALDAQFRVNRRERRLIQMDAADRGGGGPLRRWRSPQIQRDRDKDNASTAKARFFIPIETVRPRHRPACNAKSALRPPPRTSLELFSKLAKCPG